MEMRRARLPRDAAFRAAVLPLWGTMIVQSMHSFCQHGDTSALVHCLTVSWLSYLYCCKHGLNARAAARGALLHDFFLYDWHQYHAPRGSLPHGFTHAGAALENAQRHFALTKTEKDVIAHHMFPLNLRFPRTPEGRAVMMIDKYVSLRETIGRPVRLPEE